MNQAINHEQARVQSTLDIKTRSFDILVAIDGIICFFLGFYKKTLKFILSLASSIESIKKEGINKFKWFLKT